MEAASARRCGLNVEKLWHEHSTQIERAVHKVCARWGMDHLREDVVGEVWLHLVGVAHLYRPQLGCPAISWAMVVARRHANGVLRAAVRRQPMEAAAWTDQVAAPEPLVPAVRGPVRALEAARPGLGWALLCRLQGHTWAQTARVTGLRRETMVRDMRQVWSALEAV